MCLLFWVLFTVTVLEFVKRWRRERLARTEILADVQLRRAAVLLLFFAGSIALPVMLNLGARFGMVGFPLFVLSAFASFNLLREQKWIAAGWLIAVGTLLILSFQTRASIYQVAVERPEHFKMNQSYIDAAESAPPGLLLILDDFTGFDAGTRWFQEFSGFQGRIVRVNDVAMVNPGCYESSTVQRQSATTLKIVFPRRPECNLAMFRAVTQEVPVDWHRKVDNVEIDYDIVPGVGLVSANIHVPQYVRTSLMLSETRSTRCTDSSRRRT